MLTLHNSGFLRQDVPAVYTGQLTWVDNRNPTALWNYIYTGIHRQTESHGQSVSRSGSQEVRRATSEYPVGVRVQWPPDKTQLRTSHRGSKYVRAWIWNLNVCHEKVNIAVLRLCASASFVSVSLIRLQPILNLWRNKEVRDLFS